MPLVIFLEISLEGCQAVFATRRSFKRADLKYGLEISLEEAASGITTDIRVPSWEGCSDCGSSGCKKGTKPEVCSSCGGQGQVRMQQGFFSYSKLVQIVEELAENYLALL